MAFQVGNSSGISAEINITPMIDILLVLLIIMMLMRSFTSEGEQALVPQPPTQDAKLQPERTIVVQLVPGHAGKPQVMINQVPVAWEDLTARIRDIYKQRAEKVIFVKADAEVEFSDVAQVIDAAHNEGIDKVGLITAKIEGGVGQ